MSIIQLDHVSVTFKRKKAADVQAVQDVTLHIEKGDIYGIVGFSGAGKSTLVRTINLLQKPTAGDVVVGGVDFVKDGKQVISGKDLQARRRKIGMIFQQFNLLNETTVIENIAFALKHSDLSDDELEEKCHKLLKLVDLEDKANAYPAQLSGGQQQRVAIARAIINEPKVLLLDECLSALDKRLRKEMQFELRAIQKKLGITFIFVTHDQEEALAMSDEIFVLNDGEIQQSGSPVDIYDEPVNDFVARFIGDSNILSGRMIRDFAVEFAGKDFECADAGITPGEKVEVVLRPEDLDITEPAAGKLLVTVQSQLFLGDHFEIKAIGQDGFEWLIHSTNGVQIGQEVGIFFDPEDIHVMRLGETEEEFDARLETYEGED